MRISKEKGLYSIFGTKKMSKRQHRGLEAPKVVIVAKARRPPPG
jgi:hypothetical protein